MQASCQCGIISFKTSSEKPLSLWKCHCLECQKQSSSAFGLSAIFPYFPAPQHPDLKSWTRPTDSGKLLKCYFCANCGARLLHQSLGSDTTTVKGGALDDRHELEWINAPHIWTKRAMTSIPKGSVSFPGEPPEE